MQSGVEVQFGQNVQIPAIYQLSPYSLHWFFPNNVYSSFYPLLASKGSLVNPGYLNVLPAKNPVLIKTVGVGT